MPHQGDRVCRSIEINEIAAAHVDGPDTQPHLAGIDTLEVDETLSVLLSRLVS
jgi:hypothetical protein